MRPENADVAGNRGGVDTVARKYAASIGMVIGLALAPAGAAGQGSVPGVDRIEQTEAGSRQFDELVRLAGDRLKRALLIDEDDEDGRRPLLAEAERYARSAAQLQPDEAEGWFLTAASLGLRSQYESTRQQVRIGGEMLALANTALERNPDHAGAHHIVGRLNLEAMSLSGFARMIATHLYGSEMLRQASWQRAEEHLRRAVRLEPDALYHRLWLARLYIERGEEDDARRLLEQIGTMSAETELDAIWKAEAAEDLAEL